MILGGQVLNAALWFPVPSFQQLPKRWDRGAGVTTRAAKKQQRKKRKTKGKKGKQKRKKEKRKRRKRRKRVKEKKEGFPQEAIWYRVKDIG